MDKQELIERIEDFPCEASLVTEMIRINKNTLLGWVKELDEPQKPVVPQFVADWIEYCKENHLTITGAFEPVSEHGIGLAETFKGSAYKCTRWALDNQNLFARAWLDGYEVEKEKRYLVKMKGVSSNMCYLNRVGNKWIIAGIDEHTGMNIYTKHTRKQLEEVGFGWVFDYPGIEIEELE